MALDKVQGRDIGIAVEKDVNGSSEFVLVGCVTDSTFDVDTETDEATCQASGKFKEFIGGQTGFTLGGTLNVRHASGTDIDENVTAEDLLDIQLSDNNVVQVRYRLGSKTGSAWYTGEGIITKSSFKGQLKGIATYALSVQGSGPLVKTVAP
jgi:predicted secreted protein